MADVTEYSPVNADVTINNGTDRLEEKQTFHFQDDMFRWEHIIFTVSYSVLGFTAILGNSLAIAAFLKRKSLLTKHSVSLFSLAIADTLNGLSFISLAVQFGTKINFYLLDKEGNDVINVYGVIINALQMFPAYCSGIHTLLIGFERHLALVHPFKYHTDFTKRIAIFGAIGVWVFAVTANLAPAVAIVIAYLSGDGDLVYRIRIFNTIYQGVLGLIVYSVVVVMLAVMSCIICHKFNKRRSRFQDNEVNTKDQDSNHAFDKILKICVIILAYFTVSYAPYVICSVLGMFNTNIVAYKGMFYFSLLAATNSCINVFIYVFMSEKFQLTIKAMIVCDDVVNSSTYNASSGDFLSHSSSGSVHQNRHLLHHTGSKPQNGHNNTIVSTKL